MARPKNKIARYAVYLNQAQDDALKALMKEAMADTPSAYLGQLIAQTWARKTGAPKGRPKGSTAGRSTDRDDSEPEEEERNIPHPDDVFHAGELMTATEYEGYCALKGLDPATGLPR